MHSRSDYSVRRRSVPEWSPHIHALYPRHGFEHRGQFETILLASVNDPVPRQNYRLPA